MEEPLCTYKRYPQFKKIAEKIYENKEEDTIELVKQALADLDEVT